MFYVIGEAGTIDAFLSIDDDCVPEEFATEAEAIAKAKLFCGKTYIVKAVASVTDRTTYKVTKIK